MTATKCLLYCTKAKPEIVTFDIKDGGTQRYSSTPINGKIVAECEVETEKLKMLPLAERENNFLKYENEEEILKESCLSELQLRNYLINDEGYALHIKNLKTKMLSFDKDCIFKKPHGNETITRAPQNMQWCFDRFGNRYALISIRSEWLCKILNREKTIEIRKKVLKGMCDDD